MTADADSGGGFERLPSRHLVFDFASRDESEELARSLHQAELAEYEASQTANDALDAASLQLAMQLQQEEVAETRLERRRGRRRRLLAAAVATRVAGARFRTRTVGNADPQSEATIRHLQLQLDAAREKSNELEETMARNRAEWEDKLRRERARVVRARRRQEKEALRWRRKANELGRRCRLLERQLKEKEAVIDSLAMLDMRGSGRESEASFMTASSSVVAILLDDLISEELAASRASETVVASDYVIEDNAINGDSEGEMSEAEEIRARAKRLLCRVSTIGEERSEEEKDSRERQPPAPISQNVERSSPILDPSAYCKTQTQQSQFDNRRYNQMKRASMDLMGEIDDRLTFVDYRSQIQQLHSRNERMTAQVADRKGKHGWMEETNEDRAEGIVDLAYANRKFDDEMTSSFDTLPEAQPPTTQNVNTEEKEAVPAIIEPVRPKHDKLPFLLLEMVLRGSLSSVNDSAAENDDDFDYLDENQSEESELAFSGVMPLGVKAPSVQDANADEEEVRFAAKEDEVASAATGLVKSEQLGASVAFNGSAELAAEMELGEALGAMDDFGAEKDGPHRSVRRFKSGIEKREAGVDNSKEKNAAMEQACDELMEEFSGPANENQYLWDDFAPSEASFETCAHVEEEGIIEPVRSFADKVPVDRDDEPVVPVKEIELGEGVITMTETEAENDELNEEELMEMTVGLTSKNQNRQMGEFESSEIPTLEASFVPNTDAKEGEDFSTIKPRFESDVLHLDFANQVLATIEEESAESMMEQEANEELDKALVTLNDLEAENDELHQSVEEAMHLAISMEAKMATFLQAHELSIKDYENQIASLKNELNRVMALPKEELPCHYI